MKPVDVKDNTYIDFKKEVNDKNPKFKVDDHVRISKYKNIFAKGYVPNWSEEIFIIKKIKNTVPWTYVINDLNGEEIIGTFYEKELQKTNKKEFRIEKVIKRKGNKLYFKWKGYDSPFKNWIDKKDLVRFYWFQFHCIKISKDFPELYEPLGGDINVTVDLSNYATKTNIRNISNVDTSGFALKINLTNLKTEGDKLDLDKLVPILVDLSKRSDVIKNDIVKKDVCNKLVAKVNNIDTSRFVSKTKYDTYESELENKIPDASGLIKKTDYNTKIAEIEGKIRDISNLATKTALTTVENKIPSVSNLLKKTDYNTKVTEIEIKLNNHNHDKYIDTQEFNKLAADVFNARMAQANLLRKTDFDAKL